MHIIAHVWCEPHEIGSANVGTQIVQQALVRVSSRDHSRASCRVTGDVVEVHEWVVSYYIAAGTGTHTIARHVFHVRFPAQPSSLQPVDNIDRSPGGTRACVRVRISIIASTTERGSTCQREIIGKAWMTDSRVA